MLCEFEAKHNRRDCWRVRFARWQISLEKSNGTVLSMSCLVYLFRFLCLSPSPSNSLLLALSLSVCILFSNHLLFSLMLAYPLLRLPFSLNLTLPGPFCSGTEFFHDVCQACQSANPKFRCPCSRVRYCNRQCQKNHWPKHKPRCLRLRVVRPKPQ